MLLFLLTLFGTVAIILAFRYAPEDILDSKTVALLLLLAITAFYHHLYTH